MFLTFSYFTFYGMMAVGLTPNQQLAAVVSSAFYSLWNLLSGFLIPKPVSNIFFLLHTPNQGLGTWSKSRTVSSNKQASFQILIKMIAYNTNCLI